MLPFSFFIFLLTQNLALGSQRQAKARSSGKAPAKKAAAKPAKGKKRALSVAESDVPSQPAAKKRRATEAPAEVDTEVDGSDLASCAQALIALAPQMVQLLSTMGAVPYEHPTLITAPEFLTGLPAKALMPKKEPTGSRRVNVKRMPTWKLEPGLETFGPFIKKAGISYTLQDLSVLARALPDVSPLFLSSFFMSHCLLG